MSHYKRGYPRRSVRCVICTDHRDGNKGKPAAQIADGWEAVPARRSHKKRPRPYVVEYRRLGPKPLYWGTRWGVWGAWKIHGRYATLQGAEQASAQLRNTQERWYGKTEYRVRFAVDQAESTETKGRAGA